MLLNACVTNFNLCPFFIQMCTDGIIRLLWTIKYVSALTVLLNASVPKLNLCSFSIQMCAI